MDFNESAQPQAAAQAPSHFDTPNAFDQFDSTNTIDVNELLSKVNWGQPMSHFKWLSTHALWWNFTKKHKDQRFSSVSSFPRVSSQMTIFDLEVTWGLPSLCFLDLNLDFIFRYKIDLASKPADPIIILSRQDFEWGHKVQYFGSKIFESSFLISGQQTNV